MDVKVGGVYTALKAYDAGLDVTTVKSRSAGSRTASTRPSPPSRARSLRAPSADGRFSFAAGGAADDEEGRTTPCRVSLSDVYAFVVVLALILLWGCVFALSK